MHNQWRTILRSLGLVALSLLTTASFTLAPVAAVACAPAQPEPDGSPVRLESSIPRGAPCSYD